MISTVSVAASRMPSSTSAFSTMPFLMRITDGSQAALVDRGQRHDRRRAHFARDATVGEQAADERVARVRERRR